MPPDASEDERDVLVQRDEIAASLVRLGFDPVSLVMSLDAESVKKILLDISPACVFNLVESLSGSDRLIGFIPSFLESLALKYTGSGSEAMTISGNKVHAKRIMRMACIPTPFYFNVADIDKIDIPAGEYIIKSVYEHASVGIHEGSIVNISGTEDKRLVKDIASGYKTACFAEQYIDGREFNISMLEGPGGHEVLPYAEIIFRNFSEDKHKIVGYEAKWDTDSFESANTVRNYDFQESDSIMLGRLERYSLLCWDVFGLKGYARVDFRVDREGQPWVLEINTNPCLSSDAGFMAAASRKGMNFDQVISRIINL